MSMYNHGACLVSREACFDLDGAHCLRLAVCSATYSACKRHSPAVAAPGPGPIGGPGHLRWVISNAICLLAIKSNKTEKEE